MEKSYVSRDKGGRSCTTWKSQGYPSHVFDMAANDAGCQEYHDLGWNRDIMC